MPKRRFCLLLLLLCAHTAIGQTDDEYYPFAEPEQPPAILRTDSALFHRAIHAATDLYGEQTLFALPQVTVRRRGQDYSRERIVLDGMTVGFRHAAALRLLGADEELHAGLASAPETAGSTGGVRRFRFASGEPLRPYRLSVHFSDRDYRTGVRLSANRDTDKGWSLAAAADLRTGRDMHAEGVFTDAATVAVRAAKRWSGDRTLALTAIVPLSVRGLRLSSVEEAYTLTGDRLYNPAWGYQAGKVRNSRVRREALPLAAVSWHRPLSPSTELTATAGAEWGVRKYSALGWYDARTPMPDHYRYLPSYTGDRATEEAWRSGDSRYTQIRWDELIRQNRMRGGPAAYTLEDRAERIRNLRLDLAFATGLGPDLTLRYGLCADLSATRSYKQMRDLLGAGFLVDIDQYLVDDDAFGNLLQNDLRHPDRTIRKGDRFGYDYTLARRTIEARLRAEYRTDRLRADLDLSSGSSELFRTGHFEKELFPGNGSFGRSRRMRFAPYTIKALVGYSFSPRHYLELSAMAAAVAPEAARLFYQPLYNNRTVDRPVAEHLYAVEANYRQTGPVANLQATVYAMAAYDGIETRRYYDDMAGRYCDLAVTGIATMSYGIEAAASIRLSSRWRLSLAASAGRSTYIRNPRVTVLADADNTVVDNLSESYMGGCETGGFPRLTGCAEAAYFGPKGWGFRISSGYAGGRYVEPACVRRTSRISRQGGISQEAFDAFTRQERLKDAFTLDASLFKSFYWGRSQLTAALMLRNLTGGDDTVRDGYESLRVQRIRAGAQTCREPQATRYSYAYPRSIRISIAWRF